LNALYNLALCAGLAIGAPVVAAALILSPRLRCDFGERLRPLAGRERPAIWVHAASVGEAEAAAPLIDALRGQGHEVLATTLTTTGRDRMRALEPAVAARLAPLDLPLLTGRSLRRARVSALVLIETEIWPNLIAAAHALGIPVVIASGRVSDRSFPRYRRLRPFFASLLRRVDAIGARSHEDRGRFVALGAHEQRVRVTGDLKLARAAPPAPTDELRAALGAGPWLIAGSTHAGEEALVVEAWAGLNREQPLRLLLAPRHPERVPELLQMLRSADVRAGLRSRGAADTPVVILDTVGELGSLYHLAELVFVGGSLVPVGGHNLLEPVQAGRVVVHGPHLYNQRSQVEVLDPLGVLHRVDDAPQLLETLRALRSDPDRDRPADLARPVLELHRSSIDAAVRLVEGKAHA
jgi:3-deoxy-D-manno-octulosonic-acid transferase